MVTEQELGAMQIVQKYSMWSAAAGLVPIPVFDMAAIAAVQVKMLSALAHHYQLPLKEDWGKATVSALIGAVVPTGLAYGGAGLLIRRIPLVGPLLGAVTMPAFATAVTYAIGKVFIRHFESGGTLLDFNADEKRSQVQDEFARAKATA
jgi:uncharacterized protein (DUF697 family)